MSVIDAPVDLGTQERFWEKVEIVGTCWEWQGAKNHKGYGMFRVNRGGRASSLAHRFAYESVAGPVPMGLQLDHLCRNPACVRASHLQAVTARENIHRRFDGLRRVVTKPAIARPHVGFANALKTSCKHGHPFDDDNTEIKVRPDGKVRRQCRACNRERVSRWWRLTGKSRPRPRPRTRAEEVLAAALTESLVGSDPDADSSRLYVALATLGYRVRRKGRP